MRRFPLATAVAARLLTSQVRLFGLLAHAGCWQGSDIGGVTNTFARAVQVRRRRLAVVRGAFYCRQFESLMLDNADRLGDGRLSPSRSTSDFDTALQVEATLKRVARWWHRTAWFLPIARL